MFRLTPDRKLYVFGFRIHHGLQGCALVALGLILTFHDRKDFPWRLRDLLD